MRSVPSFFLVAIAVWVQSPKSGDVAGQVTSTSKKTPAEASFHALEQYISKYCGVAGLPDEFADMQPLLDSATTMHLMVQTVGNESAFDRSMSKQTGRERRLIKFDLDYPTTVADKGLHLTERIRWYTQKPAGREEGMKRECVIDVSWVNIEAISYKLSDPLDVKPQQPVIWINFKKEVSSSVETTYPDSSMQPKKESGTINAIPIILSTNERANAFLAALSRTLKLIKSPVVPVKREDKPQK